MGHNTRNARKYNTKAYKQYLFRCRRDSVLAERLAHHAEQGETSVNYLITVALCKYLNIPIPHKWYEKTQRTQIWP